MAIMLDGKFQDHDFETGVAPERRMTQCYEASRIC